MLSQLYLQYNSHVADLIEPVVAILDAASVKRLAENRESQFVTVETMVGTLKKEARVKRVLHELLIGHEIVAAQECRGNTSVLHAHEDLKVYSTVDVCIKDSSGKTILRQYYSPPPQIKLEPVPLTSEAIQKDLQLNSPSGDLAAKLFGDGDSHVIDSLIIPVRPGTPETPSNHTWMKTCQ